MREVAEQADEQLEVKEASLRGELELAKRQGKNSSNWLHELLNVRRVVMAKVFVPELEIEWAGCDCAGGLGGRHSRPVDVGGVVGRDSGSEKRH